MPNILTSVRIALALIFPFAGVSWRAPIVALALLTEYLDGAIGRWFGVASRLGQLLDPVADKLFFFAVVFTFIKEGHVSVGEVVLVGLRDIGVLAATIWTLAQKRYSLMRRMKPILSGKVVTVFQYLVCFDVLFAGRINTALLCVTTLLSFLAAVHYAFAFREMWRSPSAAL